MNKETYTVKQEKTFLSAFGESLSFFIEQINLQKDDQGEISALSLTLISSFSMYQKIIDEALFNLFPEINISHPQDVFVDGPIEITLRLKNLFVNYLNHQMRAAAASRLSLLENYFSGENNCFFHTENWLAISFQQQVTLPEHLKDNGVLKEGYQTLWKDPEKIAQKLALASLVSPYLLIKTVLGLQSWPYEIVNENIFKLQITVNAQQWVMLVTINRQEETINVYSVYPEAIALDHRESVAIFMAGINYELSLGNLEMDLNDGEVRLRTSMPLESIFLNEKTLNSLIEKNVIIAQEMFSQLHQLTGKLTD